MERIILIETSTALCSTALVENGEVCIYRESDTPRSHASLTAVFVDDMLKERGIGINQCDAVCVSMGPGSYTGLRVGVSTAKGLCFGADIPLLAVGTLDTLAYQAVCESLLPEGCKYIVPMVDARRMEVYSAAFDTDCKQISQTQAVVVDGGSYSELLQDGKVLFLGDGAGKCADVLACEAASFVQCYPKASSMARAAMVEFKEKRFKDVAYFEPFYLKDFVATTSHKKLF